MTKFKVLIAAILPLMCFACLSAKQTQVRRQPLAQSIAGIRVGPNASTDQEVTRTFGNGLFVDEEGHCGGRYFTDPSRSITLHIENGVDRIIDTVELTQGVSLPRGMDPSSPELVSKALVSAPPVDKRLHLGMSCDQVIKKLGQPKSDVKSGKERVITYQTNVDEDSRVGLDYEATYTFVDDRLVKISLYDGE